MKTMSERTFMKKFGDLIMDGLSSKMTYIILRQKTRAGLHLAIRPFVWREGSDVIMIGGKIRTGYDATYVKDLTLKNKVVALSERGQKHLLETEFGGFKWTRADNRRVSTLIALPVIAGKYDGELFLKKFKARTYGDDVLVAVEKAIGEKVGIVGDPDSRDRMFEAFSAALFQQLPHVFNQDVHLVSHKEKQIVQLPDDLVGEAGSQVVNQTNESYGKEVTSLQAHADKKKQAAQADAGKVAKAG